MKDLKQWEKPVEELTQEYIGETEVILDGDRAIVRRNETNLGNLITDSIVRAAANFTHPDLNGQIQLALMNSGGIRGEIPVGEVKETTNLMNKKFFFVDRLWKRTYCSPLRRII